MKTLEDIQSLGQQNSNTAIKLYRALQTIAADTTDYTMRLFEDSAGTFEKLLSAKSVEQALELQSGGPVCLTIPILRGGARSRHRSQTLQRLSTCRRTRGTAADEVSTSFSSTWQVRARLFDLAGDVGNE
jgi:hypothetical protein